MLNGSQKIKLGGNTNDKTMIKYGLSPKSITF